MSPSSTPSCRAAAITRFTAASVLEVAASKLASRVSTPNMIVMRLGTTFTSASPVTLMVCCSEIDCAEQQEASKTNETAKDRIDFSPPTLVIATIFEAVHLQLRLRTYKLICARLIPIPAVGQRCGPLPFSELAGDRFSWAIERRKIERDQFA